MPSTSHNLDFEEKDDQPHKLTQSELRDLMRDLDLSQEKAELLGSRLQQWDILQNDVIISVYRKRRDLILVFF